MPHKIKKNHTDVVNLSGDSSSQYSENRSEQLSENAANDSGANRLATLNEGYWTNILPFFHATDMTRLTLISRGINRTVVSSPYAFTMPIASPDVLFVKNTLNFYQVSNLKNRVPALYRSIPIIEKTISYKIANYTPTLSGICNVYNRLNTYGATISITQLGKDSYLYALLPIIGLVCGISISYLCNSFVHSFLGDYVAVDFLVGGAMQIASSLFLSVYAGAVIGTCAGYPFKQYGQYVGQMVTSSSALLGSQLGTFYFSCDKIFHDTSKNAVAFSGGMAVLALGLFANKERANKNKTAAEHHPDLIELRKISNQLEGLTRVSQNITEASRWFMEANRSMNFYAKSKNRKYIHEALAAYNNTIALVPNNAEYLAYRAFCHMQLHDEDAAKKDMRTAKKLPVLTGTIGTNINKIIRAIEAYLGEQKQSDFLHRM